MHVFSVLLASGLFATGLFGGVTAAAAAERAPQVLPSGPLAMAPGTPGVPQPPTVLFEEGFQNVAAGNWTMIDNYVGPSGATYTADPPWRSVAACNGIVTSKNSVATPGCRNSAEIQEIARLLGVVNGAPNPATNFSVSAYTDGNPGANLIELTTVNPIPVNVQNRFISFSVNVVVQNCHATHPLLNFALLDGAVERPASSTPLDPCSMPEIATNARGGVMTANAPTLFSGTTLGLVLRNAQGSGSGNDHGFDDIEVLDVTPQLDKAFSPATIFTGETSTLSFTITNTADRAAKPGWSFADSLPAGVQVASPNGFATTCTNGAATAPAGGTAIQVSGDLIAGQESCTVSVAVTSSALGTHDNCPVTNVTNLIGLNAPDCASLEVLAAPPLVFNKQMASGPAPVAGQADTYDVGYRLAVQNPGTAVTSYDLSDTLQFGSNVSIVAAPTVTNTQPGGLTPDFAWNGTSEVRVVANEAIQPGATHVWEVVARVTFPQTNLLDPQNNCTLEIGETGTGLRNIAALSQPNNPDQSGTACRASGFPEIDKTGVVVSGQDVGSTTTTEAGDEIEWKVSFQTMPEIEADGVTITDAVTAAQGFVPGSLEVPGDGWSAIYSTTPGSLDPADYSPVSEPGGVQGVGGEHPTNGLPTALGGTADFPTPVAQTTTGQVTAIPADFYCASSTPTITGWDRLILYNLPSAEYGPATLTLRDANGAIVPGWSAVDVTAQLVSGSVDLSSVPYGGMTTTLTAELVLDNIDATAFQPWPDQPSISIAWNGDAIELCFRTTVEAVCDAADIANLAQLVYRPNGPAPETSSAAASFDYVATSADCFDLSKTLVDRSYLGAGRWQLSYEVEVTSASPAAGRYDLDDQLTFGDGITIAGSPAPTATNIEPGGIGTEAAWTGTAPTVRVASEVPILAGATHGWVVEVQADVAPSVAGTPSADCSLDGGELGTGLRNTATLSGDGGGAPVTGAGCEVPLFPQLSHVKQFESLDFDEITGEGEAVYLLTESAFGEGLAEYDVTDALEFGTDAAITSTVVTAIDSTPPGPIVPGWTGTGTDTLAIDGAVIDSGEVQEYLVTVGFRVTGTTTGPADECQAGFDLYNTSALISSEDVVLDEDSCIYLPTLAVVDNGGGPTQTANTGIGVGLALPLGALLLGAGLFALLTVRRRTHRI